MKNNKLYKRLSKNKATSLMKQLTIEFSIIIILIIMTNSTSWSFQEDYLTIETFYFKTKDPNYFCDFTIKFYNGYDYPIESIDAFIVFEGKKGNILAKVYIEPNVSISANDSNEISWTSIVNPFSRLFKTKKDEIRAKLLVREITFLNGEKMSLMQNKNVVY